MDTVASYVGQTEHQKEVATVHMDVVLQPQSNWLFLPNKAAVVFNSVPAWLKAFDMLERWARATKEDEQEEKVSKDSGQNQN